MDQVQWKACNLGDINLYKNGKLTMGIYGYLDQHFFFITGLKCTM